MCLPNECVDCRSCAELLLLLPQHVPGALWEEFQTSMKVSIMRVVKNQPPPLPQAHLCIYRQCKITEKSMTAVILQVTFAAKFFSAFLSAFAVGTRPLARKRERTASPSLISGTAGWRLVERHTERHLIQSNPSCGTRSALPRCYRRNDQKSHFACNRCLT